jgi:hypothetical protein
MEPDEVFIITSIDTSFYREEFERAIRNKKFKFKNINCIRRATNDCDYFSAEIVFLEKYVFHGTTYHIGCCEVIDGFKFKQLNN